MGGVPSFEHLVFHPVNVWGLKSKGHWAKCYECALSNWAKGVHVKCKGPMLQRIIGQTCYEGQRPKEQT